MNWKLAPRIGLLALGLAASPQYAGTLWAAEDEHAAESSASETVAARHLVVRELIATLIAEAQADGSISGDERRVILSAARHGLPVDEATAIERSLSSTDPSADSVSTLKATPLTVAGARAVATAHPPINDAHDDDDDGDSWINNMYLFGALDAYKGQPDCGWPSNFGVRLGFNSGMPIMESLGIGGQFGLSYATYDWHGRGSTDADDAGWAEQMFWTVGVFQRNEPCDEACGLPLSWGVVYDSMLTDNFGVDSSELVLGQWRGQIEYALSTIDAVGLWGTINGRGDKQNSAVGPETFESLDQLNVFWHHQLCGGSDARGWVGLAEDPGEFTAGGDLNMPLNSCLAAFVNAHYIKPSASGGNGRGWHDEYWNLSVGLSYYPGATAQSSSVCGRRWMPYLSMPNNGSFAVESHTNE